MRRKQATNTNTLEPTKMNSKKVILNVESGNHKELTKQMLVNLKKDGYDKEVYIIFHSALEMRYYRDILLPKINMGLISVICQPKFTILDKVEKEGIKHMAVTYSPDFGVTDLLTGVTSYIDTKGMLDQVFPIKRKMFDSKFPDFPPLIVMKYLKKFGGWITIEQYDKFKKDEKKLKKQEGDF